MRGGGEGGGREKGESAPATQQTLEGGQKSILFPSNLSPSHKIFHSFVWRKCGREGETNLPRATNNSVGRVVTITTSDFVIFPPLSFEI